MARQRVYVDSNVLIALLEPTIPEAGGLATFLSALADKHSILTSEITLGEVLVAPLRVGDRELVETYMDLPEPGGPIEVVPVNQRIVLEAAALRARSSMRLPDAIHVATASIAGCSAFLSLDKRLHLPAAMQQIDATAASLQKWLAL
jgi:predicted nucleic acid-binding protein